MNDAAAGLDQRAFRDALGAFATGVTVVTAAEPDGSGAGITANSFTSVSLEPPLVLWCLGCDSERRQVFASAARFAVSILAADQEALSRRFAACADIPAGDPAFERGADGALVARDALARLVCRTHQRHEAGDHLVIIGEVERFDGPRPAAGLSYFRGGYGRVG